jgi:hypothetical protein
LAKSYEGQFDVVEPEYGTRHQVPLALQSQNEAPAEPHSPATSSTTTNAQGRYVPKPKYRNIFSTLRRRVGRGG